MKKLRPRGLRLFAQSYRAREWQDPAEGQALTPWAVSCLRGSLAWQRRPGQRVRTRVPGLGHGTSLSHLEKCQNQICPVYLMGLLQEVREDL